MIRFGYADTDEGQVPYVEAGDGEPFILLHLAPRSARAFIPLIPLLSHRYRAIAVDMLGFGEAPSIPVIDGVLQLDAVARNITEVMNYLGVEKAHVLGVHTGAHFAAQAAANFPERFASLILVGLGMREDEADAHLNVSAMARYSGFPEPRLDGTHLMQLWIRWYGDVLRYWLSTRKSPTDPEAVDIASFPSPYRPIGTFLRDYELEFIENGVIDTLRLFKRNGMAAHDEMMLVDMPELLSRITIPSVHLNPGSPYGSPFCQRGRRVAELIPDCEVGTLEGVDEHVCELSPEIIAEPILQFLGRHPL